MIELEYTAGSVTNCNSSPLDFFPRAFKKNKPQFSRIYVKPEHEKKTWFWFGLHQIRFSLQWGTTHYYICSQYAELIHSLV